jgi:hypothetical protein
VQNSPSFIYLLQVNVLTSQQVQGGKINGGEGTANRGVEEEGRLELKFLITRSVKYIK